MVSGVAGEPSFTWWGVKALSNGDHYVPTRRVLYFIAVKIES